MKRRTIPTLAALALACQACAQTGLPRPNEPIDTEVGRFVRRVPGDKIVPRVEQHGSKVTVRATRTCDLEKVRVVDRASLVVMPDQRTTPALVLLIGSSVGLLGLIGFGVALGNHGGPTAAGVGAAGGVTGVGAALILGGVLALRHPPSAVSVMRLDIEDGVLQAGVACRDVPSALPHEPVTGRAAGTSAIALGETDARGALEIDLAATLPPPLLHHAAPGATLQIFLRERAAGLVRLDEVSSAMEASAWASAGAEACLTGSTEGACLALEGYLRERPDGPHAAEARTTLERGKATLPARIAVAVRERAAAAREQTRRDAEANRQRAVIEAAKKGAALACRRICQTSCKGDADCISLCAARSCP